MSRGILTKRSNSDSTIPVVFGRMKYSLLFVVALSCTTDLNAQTAHDVDPILQDLLIQIAATRDSAETSLSQMPDQVSEEVAIIMADFNETLAGRVHERFIIHYEDVDAVLGTVSLPAEVGNLRLVWTQLKAGTYDSRDLDRLVEDFISDAQHSLEPHREELSQFMEAQIGIFLTDNLKRAQQNIWEPYANIPGRYFPTLKVPNLPAPPLPALSEVSPDIASSRRGLAALAGTALLHRGMRAQIAKKIPDRIRRQIKRKLLGKVAAKGIPFIGVFLLGLEAWDASRARVHLERELRSGFLDSYRTEFSTQTMLDGKFVDGEPSVRERTRAVVRERLRSWTTHCRLQIERMLDAAEVASLSPNVETYIQNQVGNGRNAREIVEELIVVQESYPPEMIRENSFRELLSTLRGNKVLDTREFKHLASRLGSQLLREYVHQREEVFVTADLLGVDVFLELFRTRDDVNWHAVRTAFEQYSPDMSEAARRGLLLALHNGVAQPGIPIATLSNFHRNSELFRGLATVLREDKEKLFRLFADPPLLEIVRRALSENPEAARPFIVHWNVQAWVRYRSQERFRALFLVVDYRLSEKRQLAPALAQEMADRDVLTPIVLDVGICGLKLWDAYGGTSPGRLQQEQASTAIQLFRKGFPCEFILTKEGFEDARLYAALPFGVGVFAFREIGSALKLILVGSVLIILIIILAMSWKMINKVKTRRGVVRPHGTPLGERVRKVREKIRSATEVNRSEVE